MATLKGFPAAYIWARSAIRSAILDEGSTRNLGCIITERAIMRPSLALLGDLIHWIKSCSSQVLQTDPIGYQDQFNLYTYVGNDPLNATDPGGMEQSRSCGWSGFCIATNYDSREGQSPPVDSSLRGNPNLDPLDPSKISDEQLDGATNDSYSTFSSADLTTTNKLGAEYESYRYSYLGTPQGIALALAPGILPVCQIALVGH